MNWESWDPTVKWTWERAFNYAFSAVKALRSRGVPVRAAVLKVNDIWIWRFK